MSQEHRRLRAWLFPGVLGTSRGMKPGYGVVPARLLT